VAWGFEPLHPPLPLTRALVGVLRPMVQVAVLAMLDARQYISLRGMIALQLISDHYTRNLLASLEQLTNCRQIEDAGGAAD
jgi:hypothetical protein